MRKILISFLCVFSLTAFSAAPKKILNIQHWKTSAGGSVYFVSISNLPMLDVRVIFSAGSAYDGKTLGVASLTNDMIGEGTTTQSADKIAKTFDDIGARFSTGSGRDKAVVSMRTLTKPHYLNTALSELTQVISKMSFPQKTLRRVQNQVAAMIKVSQQKPGSVAKIEFYKTLYGSQPYAHNPLGTFASVKSITSADIQHFYSRYYVAKNADIILVGNLQLAQAKQIAEQISKALPSGKHALALRLATSLKNDIHRHIQFSARQTAIMIGQVGINRQNLDYFPLVVGNYAFGGLPLGSVLFQKVRNQKGLAYYIGSTFEALRYRGPFVIQLKTRVRKTKEALAVVQSALNSFLKEGPSEQQLNAAKQNLIGSFPLALSSNSNIAHIVSNIAFYRLPLNYLDTYESKVRAVTPKQVKDAFAKTIQPNRLAIITVGPTRLQK